MDPNQYYQLPNQPQPAQSAAPAQPSYVAQPAAPAQSPVSSQPSPSQPTYVQQPQTDPRANAILGSAALTAASTPAPASQDSPNSTQTTLMFSEIRDGVVIMKDGSFRAVIACRSINFDLMSEAERDGVEASYQDFLNSLRFNIQILVRSQRVDIEPYIEHLTELRRNNDNMLLGVLMDDYINFIGILADEANIMDKSFFIVVPYYPDSDVEKALEQTKNIFKTFSRKQINNVTRIDRATYEKAMDALNDRVDSVISGLYNIGVHAARLDTKGISELYYNFNNPDTAVREPLVDFSQVATMYVKKGEKNA